MTDGPHRLQYLAVARPTRLPMHSLVVGILASTFQICFGGLLGYGVVRATYRWIVDGGYFNPLWSILFVPIAAVFLASGLRLMAFTVANLRGREGTDASNEAVRRSR